MRLVDEVAAELRERIYRGGYRPGTRLRQEQVAADLEVSRTPLREALRMLEREGLVTVTERGGGVQVVSGDPATLLAAYQLREVVDGLAARLAAQCVSKRLAAALKRSLGEQGKALAAWGPGQWPRANVSFHSAILRSSGNRYLIAQLPLIQMTSHVFTPIGMLDRSRAESALAEHRLIAGAILDGDAPRAEERGRGHIRSTTDVLMAKLAAKATS